MRQLPKPTLTVAGQIERLDVGRNHFAISGRLDHREDRLAQRAGLRKLGEAPFRGEPVWRLNDHDGLGLVDLAVERLLPVGAGRNADRLVFVEKRVLEPLACEPGLHPRGRVAVAARMGDEDARHTAIPVPPPACRFAALHRMSRNTYPNPDVSQDCNPSRRDVFAAEGRPCSGCCQASCMRFDEFDATGRPWGMAAAW